LQVLRKGIYQGEQDLKKFIDALVILIDKLFMNAKELEGHVAPVTGIKKPHRASEIKDDSDASDYELKMLNRNKDKVDLRGKYLVEILDQQLMQINNKTEQDLINDQHEQDNPNVSANVSQATILDKTLMSSFRAKQKKKNDFNPLDKQM